MAVYSVPQSRLFTYGYRPWDWITEEKEKWKPGEQYRIYPSVYKPGKDDTWYVIVGPHQELELAAIEKDTRFKIVYRAPMACNSNYRRDGPRNTLFILESNDEPVSAVSTV